MQHHAACEQLCAEKEKAPEHMLPLSFAHFQTGDAIKDINKDGRRFFTSDQFAKKKPKYLNSFGFIWSQSLYFQVTN